MLTVGAVTRSRKERQSRTTSPLAKLAVIDYYQFLRHDRGDTAAGCSRQAFLRIGDGLSATLDGEALRRRKLVERRTFFSSNAAPTRSITTSALHMITIAWVKRQFAAGSRRRCGAVTRRVRLRGSPPDPGNRSPRRARRPCPDRVRIEVNRVPAVGRRGFFHGNACRTARSADVSECPPSKIAVEQVAARARPGSPSC